MSEYNYNKITSIKVIIENERGQVLLIQESETDEWMPEHWGLPGGRPALKESLYSALKRKLNEEIGTEVEPLGLYKVEELLHEDRTVLMFIVVARMQGEHELKGRVKSHKWVTLSDIEGMDTSEFSAFYYKKLLLDYLSGNREYVSFNVIVTEQYYSMQDNEAYRKWIESGKKNDKQED
jgi:ADP-ribose pyrophosphatase YjhB (NUDIX family)